MSQTFEFYDARAKESAAEAEAAELENVRERALRSERSWRNLADQARSVVVAREKANREKAERRELEEMEERAASSA